MQLFNGPIIFDGVHRYCIIRTAIENCATVAYKMAETVKTQHGVIRSLDYDEIEGPPPFTALRPVLIYMSRGWREKAVRTTSDL